MPKGPANLGYFVSKDQTIQNADSVFVLVVHYNFEIDKRKIRIGDSQDVENLEKTFKVNRNCNFRKILSPEKGQLLELLSNQEKLLRLFGCSDIPSVFVLYILSLGGSDGIIFTDHFKDDVHQIVDERRDEQLNLSELFVSFTTTDVFESLKKLTNFEECLKFINFGPCRGELIDAVHLGNQKNTPFKNENSCRITYSPMMRNTVVFFSTVETAMATRNQSGTTFVCLTCQVLNSLEMDESLINVLANIQFESHTKVDIMGKKKFSGQTPEVKMFLQDRKFFISKSTSNNSSSSTSDAKNIKFNRKREFYSWKSSSGVNLRRRLAILFSAEPNDQLKEIKRALSQNLDFETSERMLSGKPWTSINKASWRDLDIGCIFLILFGPVSENKDTNEVCVKVDSREISVSEILREFIGPKNDQWIGKPKILFLVNQETSSFDDCAVPSGSMPATYQKIGSTGPKMKIFATNYSGWLVLVLHNQDGLQELIKIIKGQELKKEKSLQELLASLLIYKSKESRDFLNSTLQYLLNFSYPFVKVTFSLTMPSKTQENQVCFDSLVEKSAGRNEIWLLSSVAGSGKTTILREMAFQLGKLHPELHILRISLPRVLLSSLSENVTEIEFLVEATHYSQQEIIKCIENRQCVVFLDGFDEIDTENQEIILKVIEALGEKRLSVWIGTRPHAAGVIQKRISRAVLVKIDPLNKVQQMEMLQLETGESKDECEVFFENPTLKDILENPLHLTLVAQYGAGENLFQIYDEIVRHKVEDSLIRNGYDKNNYNKFQAELDIALERLQQIAFCYVRGDELTDDTREQIEQINCFGIVTFEKNEVVFIHQTFTEFLAAMYFLGEIETECTEDIAKMFFEQWFSSCRKFVDQFYSTILNDKEKIEKHRALLVPLVEFKPDKFVELIAIEEYKNIFKMIHPMFTRRDVNST